MMQKNSIPVHRSLSGLIFALALGACATEAPPPPATAASHDAKAQRQAPPTWVAGAGGERTPCELHSVHFELESGELSPQAKEVLARDQRCAQQKGARALLVVGMTDPRGTDEYNLALGDQRARNAVRYLKALGAPAPEATSVGAEWASGSDEQGWAQDRRAEVRLK